MSMNIVIDETTGAETAFFPSFTATTERGWILFMPPRHISFSITMTRTTLIEPDVDAEQPPINIRSIRVN